MSDTSTVRAVRAEGAPIEQIGSLLMLHPETFEQSTEKAYPHPFAGYFAGQGGVLGQAGGDTVAAIFGVFEPGVVRTFWEQGLAVHGAAVYSEQVAEFARKHLAGAEGSAELSAEEAEELARLAEGALRVAKASAAPEA